MPGCTRRVVNGVSVGRGIDEDDILILRTHPRFDESQTGDVIIKHKVVDRSGFANDRSRVEKTDVEM